MRRKSRVLLVALCILPLVLAGCGGGGGTHTYVLRLKNGVATGIYVTIVSPVAIPTNLMMKNGSKVVGQAQGPQVCSFARTIQVQNPRSSSAFLDGKTLTLKVNGSNPHASGVCWLLKNTPFDLSRS